MFTNIRIALENTEVSLGRDSGGISAQIDSSTVPQNRKGIENIIQNKILPPE
jgi:hypothetical protein